MPTLKTTPSTAHRRDAREPDAEEIIVRELRRSCRARRIPASSMPFQSNRLPSTVRTNGTTKNRPYSANAGSMNSSTPGEKRSVPIAAGVSSEYRAELCRRTVGRVTCRTGTRRAAARTSSAASASSPTGIHLFAGVASASVCASSATRPIFAVIDSHAERRDRLLRFLRIYLFRRARDDRRRISSCT